MISRNGSAAGTSVSADRAEALLRSITGVREARIDIGPAGEILDVRILADPDVPPRQVARNVQSALLVHLGILVDHRAVTVQVDPDTTPRTRPRDTATHATAPANPAPTAETHATLESLELERLHPHRVRCRVTLNAEGRTLTGQAELMDRPGAGLDAAARTVLHALDTARTHAPIEFEGVREVEIAGRPYVIAATRTFHGRELRFLAGAAAIDDTPEDAAALAALQAVLTPISNPPRHGTRLQPVQTGRTPT